MHLKHNKLFVFVGCVMACLVIGSLGGIATAKEISTWYASLQKPFFNPPNYLFGPVWSLLYFLLGVSLYLILQESTNPLIRKKALIIFGIQLFLNFCWSFIFFKFHLLGWALLEIGLLWLSIVAMISTFYRIQRWAALINIPYLLWVSFASLLNASIYFLNR